MPRITKTLLASLTPKPSKYFVWDTDPHGFGVAVYPGGSQAFIFQYRTPHGRSRRLTIGKTSQLSPDQARKAAKIHAAAVIAGDDPAASKKKAREELSVNDLLDAYLASNAFLEKSQTTRDTDTGRINNHLRPTLGRKLARSLSSENVRGAARAIEQGKTAKNERTGWRGRSIVRGGPGAARQAIRLLSAAYAWGISERLLTDNPAHGIKKGGDGYRDIVMRNAEDYRRLFGTLDHMENERRIQSPVANIIRLIALTGARRDEIAGLEWTEVDLDKGLLTIPASRHKTGTKTNAPRIIGLPMMARQILEDVPRDSDMVFPPLRRDGHGRSYPSSRKGRPPRVNVTTPWRRVRDEAGLPSGIGLHGLRHSLATQMAMAGAQAVEIMTALGHRKLQTSQRYVHVAEDQRAALAEKAAAMITDAMGPKHGRA